MKKCNIKNCENKHYARGWCRKHYMYWWRYGNPLFTKREMHGYSNHYLYRVWADMKTRCYNENHKQYKNWGGRGIIVCNGWTSEYELIWIDGFQHGHESVSGFIYPYRVNQLSISGNDIYVPYTKSVKSGSTWYTGNIAFTVKDGTPITPYITLSWIDKPKLDWSKPCFDVKDYKIYKTSRDRWVYVGRTSNLYWTDNYFSSRTSYKIKSVDNDNNESGYSNIVTCYPPIGGEKFLSTEYVLHNAYPNPFNPTTTIKFNLPEDGFVNISIYNLLGEIVGNPVNGQMTAGKHRIQFDGSNLSSGIYFIRMNSNQFVKTQKIILAK